MLKPEGILEGALSKWPAVLRAEATGESLFPLQIPFGRPRTTADFAELKRDIEALAATHHEWQIEWQEIQTRKWGRQRWPMRITFESADDMAAALGRSREFEAFHDAVRRARESCPALEPWVRAKAHRIVDYLEEWPALVAVCAYFDANPTPRCFARQIPLPAGTKFVEEHAGILRELLDVVLGDRANAEGATFAERFHLLADPAPVRFRFLDQRLRESVGWPVDDCSVPAPSFANISWVPERVLVVENRDVFLCLPEIPRTLAIFGSGKAASLLPACRWMASTQIVYWGDCDEAGYGILSGLRSSFPQVRSLLMDHTAWCRWRHLAVPGQRDASARHAHLTDVEREALNAVVAGPWMLEQERIPPAEAERAVLTAFN